MISPEAKECNQAMLQRDPKSRPTAPQLLSMPWLAKTAPVMAPMSQSSSSFGSMTNLSSAQPGLADFNEKRAAKPKRPMGAPPGGGFRPRPVRPGGAPPPARGAVGSGTRCVRSLSACSALCLAPLVRLANQMGWFRLAKRRLCRHACAALRMQYSISHTAYCAVVLLALPCRLELLSMSRATAAAGSYAMEPEPAPMPSGGGGPRPPPRPPGAPPGGAAAAQGLRNKAREQMGQGY
jgi:hypothetical protein